MKIYFDRNKNACDFRPPDCIAEIDESAWSTYSTTEPGVGWDIIDGSFVPLMTPSETKRPILERQRKLEREIIYRQTEIELAIMEEEHVNEDISDQEYTARRKEIMAYRKSVRSTAEQSDYPFKVVYPNLRYSDIPVILDKIAEPDIPPATDPGADPGAAEADDSESEPWI